MANWSRQEGTPFPLGAAWIEAEQAYNFALFSRYATAVTLGLYAADNLVTPVLSIPLDYRANKSGRVWHCRVSQATTLSAQYYAYQIDGPPPNGQFEWHAFDKDKVLFDPYAKAVFFPPGFDTGAAARSGSNAGKAILGRLPTPQPAFDWGDDPAPFHEGDLVIYEMHVKGFTNNPNSVVTRPGTYAGVIEKIPYLVDLGVTAVELMPVHQFDPTGSNYWGYDPLGYFTPHNAYAGQGANIDPANEFRAMVKALHDAGIEVIMDVVYNHTGEGDQDGPNFFFKGIDNASYYLMTGNSSGPYVNDSGTGNTLDCASPPVRQFTADSLRYWAKEFHIDGFRFDLASVFSRNADGSINTDDPPIFDQLASDPDLAGLRFIAEPWDAAGEYELGTRFPGLLWFQWNGKFRDDLQHFVKSDDSYVGNLMTRLYGSNDVFPDTLPLAYRPYQSVNYITSHDGFTLYDLVSYNQKHNEANGNNNTDGPDDASWNCGWEGDVGAPPEVLALRKQQVKNFCCLLFLANGTPMFRAGDEFMQTQGGNNNPYNQDNLTSWLDWSRLAQNPDIYRFFKMMIAFRKAHPALSRSQFWGADVSWYGVGHDTDLSDTSHTLALCLHGASQGDQDIYVMINAYWQDLTFTVQEGQASDWKLAIDTAAASPNDIIDASVRVPLGALTYAVGARSVVVLTR
jgi:glycogen operon protein